MADAAAARGRARGLARGARVALQQRACGEHLLHQRFVGAARLCGTPSRRVLRVIWPI